MPKFVVLASFTSEHWARLLEHPEAAVMGIERAVDAVGAHVDLLHLMLGEHDVLGVIDAPDTLTQAAVSVAMASTGVFRSFTTHELLTVADLPAVVAKANTSGIGSCASDP